jgi:organic hydroperoxide reductase OsmC/OhrA
MDSAHSYRIRATSTINRSGLAIAEGIQPSISFSAPPEFQGHAGVWTPEHFLVAAVASCYVSTFSGMAATSKFEFLSLHVEAEGILGKDELGWRFSEVVLRPRLKIVRAEDSERAKRLLQKAEKGCVVGRSLACPIVLYPELKIEEELVADLKNS